MILAFGYIHAILVLSIILYPAVYQSKRGDKYFLLTCLITVLSWLVLKNECILSYFIKQYYDSNYKLGDDVANMPDLKLAKNHNTNISIFFDIVSCTGIIIPFSFLAVAVRSQLITNNQVSIFYLIACYTFLRRFLIRQKILPSFILNKKIVNGYDSLLLAPLLYVMYNISLT